MSKDSIDFLTRQIRSIETFIEKKIELKDGYKNLVTICGIGKILGLTIMLESGPMDRFEKVGNYASYCRVVSSQWNQQRQVQGQREQEERQQVPFLGILRSSGICQTL